MALTDKLSAIGTAIREKTGGSDLLTLDAMPEAIRGISGGGGEVEPIVLSGSCANVCSGMLAGKYIDLHGDTITTQNLTDISNMFYNCKASCIPFELNMNTGSGAHYCHSAFSSCDVKNIPIINNLVPYKLESMFYSAKYIREIPEEVYSTWDWSYLDSQTNAYSGYQNKLFNGCSSLRRLPMGMLEHGNPNINYGYCIYNGMAYYCSSLDEIVDLPNPHTNVIWTSDAFGACFYYTDRLKRLTFKMPNGMPYVVKWKNQQIRLEYTGYCSMGNAYGVLNYNSGITADKEVYDDATYQALKDDPDWFTKDKAYSRYNHDSAVETINSLPDASAYLSSAGGNNTIKFKGDAGAATDGGAINTLTEEEIAVAAARGWTVSFE